MSEFWESNFKDKQEMWGWEPADSTIRTLELFKKYNLNKILIPGFGYGRNAKVFTDNGFKVTDEFKYDFPLKQTMDYHKKKIHRIPVGSMPFDHELYDGIFSYGLIHLLSTKDRLKLIDDCYNQLAPNGYMVYVTISKKDFRYAQGKEIGKDTFEPWPGMTLFFYDSDSIKSDFGNYGLTDVEEIK